MSIWSSDLTSFSQESFNPQQQTGPRNIPDSLSAESRTVDFLQLFWTDDVWNLITTETNRNAEYIRANKPDNYIAKSFYPVTVNELKAFFGCRIAMELLIHKNRYEMYWKQKSSWITCTPGFGKVFTRDRFLAIWSMLHCVDELNPDLNKSDKIYKTCPIFEMIMAKFAHYYVPDCELSLDEGMIPTKNAISFKQYIKDKPIKWGIKTFLLCESKTGYIVNAMVYTGKMDIPESLPADLGVTGSLVAQLCKPYEGQNYCIFTDRYYTSVTLAKYLRENQGTYLCGTALTNRKLFPKQLIKKKMTRGTSEILFDGKVAAAVWCDKKPIYFVTTKYVSSSLVTVLRYDTKEHQRVPVQCPTMVKAYNQHMGGTDKNDQLTKLQRCRRHYKWPRRLMVKFFVWSAYNAFIVMNHFNPHHQSGHRRKTFHMFVNDLCHDLVGSFRRAQLKGSHRSKSSEVSSSRLVNEPNIPLHMPERPIEATSNNRCVVCTEKHNRAKRENPAAKACDLPKRSKTVYWCKQCQVYLCIAAGDDNCFERYHSRVQYWR